jgi:hypothetical protein
MTAMSSRVTLLFSEHARLNAVHDPELVDQIPGWMRVGSEPPTLPSGFHVLVRRRVIAFLATPPEFGYCIAPPDWPGG